MLRDSGALNLHIHGVNVKYGSKASGPTVFNKSWTPFHATELHALRYAAGPPQSAGIRISKGKFAGERQYPEFRANLPAYWKGDLRADDKQISVWWMLPPA